MEVSDTEKNVYGLYSDTSNLKVLGMLIEMLEGLTCFCFPLQVSWTECTAFEFESTICNYNGRVSNQHDNGVCSIMQSGVFNI